MSRASDHRIKVRSDEAVDDATLEKRLGRGIKRDPYLEENEVTPVVVDGTAFLYGKVNTSFEKARAEDVAGNYRGVGDVKNYINVLDGQPFAYSPHVDDDYLNYDWQVVQPGVVSESDVEIKNEIDSELWWSPFIDSDDVAAEVRSGVAILSGAVDTWSEYWAAEENALEGGAIAVRNNLRVGG